MRLPAMVTRLFRLGERKQVSHPAELVDFFMAQAGARVAASGLSVNPTTVLSLACAYACIKVIAETLASVPLRLLANAPDGSKEFAVDHPLYDVLEVRPNEWQTSFEFIEMLVAHACLRGNAYAFKNIVNSPTSGLPFIKELIPIHPDRVRVEVDRFHRLTYFVKPLEGGGPEIALPREAIWHVRALSSNGFMGVSPMTAAADVFGNALAMQQQVGRMFLNGARLSGVLSHPGSLDEETSKRIADSWKDSYAGVDNAYKVAVLEEGMTFKEVSMTAQDAQFIESRKLSWTEICAIFRVPPHKVMMLDRATFSNIEHQSIDFVTDCVMPWTRRIEQSIARDLITAPRKYYAKFMLQALLRGDSKTRAEFYASAITNGWMNRNEVRLLEDMNKGGPELDKYLEPLNMQQAGAKPKPVEDNTRKHHEELLTALGNIKAPDVHVEVAPPDVKVNTVVQPGSNVVRIARPVLDAQGKLDHVVITEKEIKS